MTTREFPGDFALLSVLLYPVAGQQKNKPVDIRELVNEINLYESIITTSLTAELVISDVGDNIISNYPLLGQEKVVITLGTKTKNYNLTYYIFKIGSRIVSERNQAYIIHLVSFEALRNETVKVSERIENKKVEDVLETYITNKIKTKKKLFYDETLYKVDLIIPNWRIFDFAIWIGKRSVPDKYPNSVGYLFYETFEGYNFRSIDKLIDQKPINENNPYTYVQANTMTNPNIELYKIYSFTSPSVVDVFKNSRMGLFCHTEIQIDFNKRELSTIKRSIEDFYNNTRHLGNTKPYSVDTDLKLNENPSRIVYRPLLNQIWSSTENEKSPAPDKFNSMFSKSVFRYHLLDFNELNISVPGNMDIRAGNVLMVSIPSPELTSNNKRVEDKRLSGKYLIHTIKHTLSNRVVLNTQIKLTRDSFGGNSQ